MPFMRTLHARHTLRTLHFIYCIHEAAAAEEAAPVTEAATPMTVETPVAETPAADPVETKVRYREAVGLFCLFSVSSVIRTHVSCFSDSFVQPDRVVIKRCHWQYHVQSPEGRLGIAAAAVVIRIKYHW